MKVGTLVRSRLDKAKTLGIVIAIKKSLFMEDVECNMWEYPSVIKVWYPNGKIEINPAELYEIVSCSMG